MATEREEILRVEVDYDAAGKNLVDLQKQLEAIKKQQAEYNKTLKKGGELSEDQQRQYAENVKQLDKVKKSQKQTTNEVVTGIKKQKGSLVDLREDLKRLVDQRNKISLDTKEGQQAVIKLNKEIKELNEGISDIEQGGGDFRRNVGNYASALDGIGINATGAISALEGVRIGSIATRAALLSIPFVAIAAIIAVFAAKLAESEKFTRALSVGFNLLKDVAKPALDLINVGVDLLIVGFEKAINFLGEFIGAFEENAETVNEQNIKNIKSFAALEKARQRQIDKERAFAIETRRLIKEEEKLKNLRDDDRKSIDERIKANEELAKLEDERISQGIKLQEDKIALIEKEIELQGGEALAGTETLNNLTEARVELEDLIEESIGRQNEAITNQVTLERELFEITQELAQKRAEVSLAEAETDKERFEAKRQLLITELKNEEAAIKQRGLNAQQQAEFLLLTERDYLVKQQELREEFGIEPLPDVLFGTKEQNEARAENFQAAADELNQIASSTVKNNIATYKEDQEGKEKSDKKKTESAKASNLQQADSFKNLTGSLAGLLEEGSAEFKAAKITETIISTAAGISRSFADLPPPANAIQAAAIGATGAAQLATIAAAAGGGDFVTNGATLLLVGDNPGGQERVRIDPIGARGQTRTAGSNLSTVSGNLEADSMREQTQAISSALQAMPPPVLVVKDYQKAERRVQVKQTVAGL